jgi:hypothetical protein
VAFWVFVACQFVALAAAVAAGAAGRTGPGDRRGNAVGVQVRQVVKAGRRLAIWGAVLCLLGWACLCGPWLLGLLGSLWDEAHGDGWWVY